MALIEYSVVTLGKLAIVALQPARSSLAATIPWRRRKPRPRARSITLMIQQEMLLRWHRRMQTECLRLSTYDNLNRLLTVVDNRLTGSNTTTYTYDDANNVATVTYPNSVQSTVAWNYDGIYRLTNETISLAPSGNNGSASYGLDPVGNRTSATSSIARLAPVSGTFNADDELNSESYDQNRNVTSTGGKTFAYDSENHLMSMNNGAVQLIYDGDGNRVAKSVSGVVTYYLVDDLNPTGYAQVVEELSGAEVVQRQYSEADHPAGALDSNPEARRLPYCLLETSSLRIQGQFRFQQSGHKVERRWSGVVA